MEKKYLNVSKDGEKFYELLDTPENRQIAEKKGYTPYIDMTKNGKDIYSLKLTAENLKKAEEKGYSTVEAFNFLNKEKDKPISKTDSLKAGAEQGLTFSFADELTGLGGAVKDTVFGDRKIEEFGDSYRENRDATRDLYKKKEEANPKSYMGGLVAGGVASSLIPGVGPLTNAGKGASALSLGSAGAKAGLVGGWGSSEGDLIDGEAGEVVKDAAIGGAVGGTLGYAGGMIGTAFSKGGKGVVADLVEPVSSAKTYSEALIRGGKEGSKEAVNNAPDIFGVKSASGIWGGIKGALRELRNTSDDKSVFQNLSNTARKILREGQDGSVGAKLSDEEAIVKSLMIDGDNEVKRFIADKAAAVYPGQVDKEKYLELLIKPSAERIELKAFDKKESGKFLADNLENFERFFKDIRNQRTKSLNNAAKANFNEANASGILSEIETAYKDATALKSVPKSVRTLIEDVYQITNDGVGTKSQNLSPGEWSKVGGGEKFTRLQQARQLIDSKLNWTKREGLAQSENILRDLRSKIDEVLKTSPEKVEADDFYRASKELENSFFGATQFRNPDGRLEVDEFKIAKLLNDTDQAGRFRNSIDKLSEFLARKDLDPTLKREGLELVNSLNTELGMAKDQRAIQGFRFANGPSSPALERMASVRGGGSVKEAVQSPSGFIFKIDQLNKIAKEKFGKNFNELDESLKTGFVKYQIWLEKNPNASIRETERVFNKLINK